MSGSDSMRDWSMRTKAQEDRLAQALSRALGESVRVEIEIVEAPTRKRLLLTCAAKREQTRAARAALADDSTARALQERFGATLHPETVRPTGK
ncbi:MAG: hypothetical protein KIT78_00615 [Steroidobacteraceae bacterium]|nr:hypothetical protein [Steroidobacteraceae bacterium]